MSWYRNYNTVMTSEVWCIEIDFTGLTLSNFAFARMQLLTTPLCSFSRLPKFFSASISCSLLFASGLRQQHHTGSFLQNSRTSPENLSIYIKLRRYMIIGLFCIDFGIMCGNGSPYIFPAFPHFLQVLRNFRDHFFYDIQRHWKFSTTRRWRSTTTRFTWPCPVGLSSSFTHDHDQVSFWG